MIVLIVQFGRKIDTRRVVVYGMQVRGAKRLPVATWRSPVASLAQLGSVRLG